MIALKRAPTNQIAEHKIQHNSFTKTKTTTVEVEANSSACSTCFQFSDKLFHKSFPANAING